MILTYKAGYKFLPNGVHAQVVDFPAVISCGEDLDDARQMLAGALIDVAETLLELGQSLPTPNPALTDAEMDVEEVIYLQLTATSPRRFHPTEAISP